jgi:general stress protein 26
MHSETHADDAAEVLAKVRNIKFAMVATHADDGEMRVRPLTLLEAEGDGTLWFFVERFSEVAVDVALDPRINASFADTSESWYVAIRGRGYIIHDPEKAEALWNPLAAAWFPGGPNDPTLGLLRIDADCVEYWKPGPGGKLMQFAAMAKAAITRKPPSNVGEHGSFVP